MGLLAPAGEARAPGGDPAPNVQWSVQELSRRVLLPSRKRSARMSASLALRARLLELRQTLDDAEGDQTPERVTRLLESRGRVDAALDRASLPPGLDDGVRELLEEVDQFAADPVGQRARFDLARQRISEALSHPRRHRATSFSIVEEWPLEGAE